MTAVVFHGIGDIRLEDVAEPGIEQPTDAIVRLTASAICGTDLHMIRGTMPACSRARSSVTRASAWSRRSAAGPVDDRLRVVLLLPRGLLRPVRQRESERATGRHRVLRRAPADRAVQRLQAGWIKVELLPAAA
jgi:hypothetical protein